jgi:uncharacterized protein
MAARRLAEYGRGVAQSSPERSAHFPAIEKKHGQPMSYWFDVMEQISERKYADQIAYLRENHGFSQAHANALVLFSRGNTTSKRFNSLEDYLKPLDSAKRSTVSAIFATITEAFPGTEVVIAWNQPMVKLGEQYLFGVSVANEHITIAPWGGVLDDFRDRLTDYHVNKKTIRVPIDWSIDRTLLCDMVSARIAQID